MTGHMGMRDVLLDGDDVVVVRSALKVYLTLVLPEDEREKAEMALHLFNLPDPSPYEENDNDDQDGTSDVQNVHEVWIVIGTVGLDVIDPQVFQIDDEDAASEHYLKLVDHLFKRPEITGPGCDEDVSASVHKVRALFVNAKGDEL